MLAVLLLPVISVFAQPLSNKGKDFWLAYAHHIRMKENPANTSPEQMQVYITGDAATSGELSIPGIGHKASFSVQPGQVTVVDVPRAAALADSGLFARGIQITAQEPIVVYSSIFSLNVSGATLCLPTSSLGTDYYSFNYTQQSNERNSAGYFCVVATDTGTTTVEITPAALTLGGRQAGVPFIVTLKQGEVYQVLGDYQNSAAIPSVGVDLTGSRIRSVNAGNGCKRIAVFSGSSKLFLGNCQLNQRSADNLYQQLIPVHAWSTRFIAVPSLENSRNYYRILRPKAQTTVRVNGIVVPNTAFQNNLYYEFAASEPQYIEADKPIAVAQYFTTFGCDGNINSGDPDMVVLTPLDQRLQSVTLQSIAPAALDVSNHFLNIVLPNTPAALATFKLDGAPVNGFQPVGAAPGFVYAQVRTTAGTHNLTCDSAFSVMAYGTGSRDAYAYMGGALLKDLYTYSEANNTNKRGGRACAGTPFTIATTFPYRPAFIRWQFKGALANFSMDAPVPDSTFTVNGEQLYRYTIPRVFNSGRSGVLDFDIEVGRLTDDGCSGVQTIAQSINLLQPVPVSLDVPDKACIGDALTFRYRPAAGAQRNAGAWNWTVQGVPVPGAATLTYPVSNPGDYAVRLQVTDTEGCFSEVAADTVTVYRRPVAAFSVPNVVCSSRPVLFQDQSAGGGDALAMRRWYVGNTLVQQGLGSLSLPTQFAASGTAALKLVVTANGVCADSISRVVTVSPTPEANFVPPATCVSDPFAQFINTSSPGQGTAASLSYTWNFGDAAVSGGGTATDREPRYRYNRVGTYPVTLRTFTPQGCADTITRMVSINGTRPKVSIAFVTGPQLCSGDSLAIVNRSSVDIGDVVRLRISDPAQVLLDTAYPAAGGTFVLPVRRAGGVNPVAQILTIESFSGATCRADTMVQLTIRPRPSLYFDTLNAVCDNATPFRIQTAGQLLPLQGTGVFSGRGVQGNGTFDPSKAGTGQHQLQYRFTTLDGCSASATQTITVWQSPVVDAGADKVLLKGGRPAQLQGTVRGQGTLRLAWSPVTSLLNATSLSPQARPDADQVYTLTVVSAEGCTATDNVLVQVAADLFIPNSFSPNGDGNNDLWRIPLVSPEQIKQVLVFDRGGMVVYQCTQCNGGWNGKLKGLPLQAGVYPYLVTLDNGKHYKGTILLLR